MSNVDPIYFVRDGRIRDLVIRVVAGAFFGAVAGAALYQNDKIIAETVLWNVNNNLPQE